MDKKTGIVALALAALALASAVPVLAIEDGGCMEREGRGWALLAGSGELGFKGKGFVVVLGEKAEIDTQGDGKVRRITPEMTVYLGRGEIKVRGEKLAIYIRGSGKLKACGKGFHDLGGRGLV